MAERRVAVLADHIQPKKVANLKDSLNESLRKDGIEVLGNVSEAHADILRPAALHFIAELARRFGATREQLLANRDARQVKLNQGANPEFLEETAWIRQSSWTCAPTPKDIQDRRVEITGPTTRKMIINALNSGSSCFMADFEDSSAPTWENMVDGQLNLRDAVAGTISLAEGNKNYTLGPKTAVLFVRPRGWHLLEKHLLVDGVPVSASLFDFGLYFFHNARQLLAKGSGPYFYLPKMESHKEARLWNEAFNFAQDRLNIARGSIKATVLIETILGAFEMDEILYELRDHSAGLNCGRWDYIFSFIKKFQGRANFSLPDRSQITMTQPFMKAYVDLLIYTCHRRGVHAMGGMSANIPVKDDKAANDDAAKRVANDKLREVKAGHDGTWVAHPGLIPIAKKIFDEHMPKANQIPAAGTPAGPQPSGTSARDLIAMPTGTTTDAGLQNNISVAIQYMAAWLQGVGCVPLFHLMEDLATAEIARSQIWSWIKNQTKTDDGQVITAARLQKLSDDITATLTKTGDGKYLQLAKQLFVNISTAREFVNFMPDVLYDYILESGAAQRTGGAVSSASIGRSLVSQEQAAFFKEVEDIERWWATPRFAHTKRPYTAADVAKLRGTLRQTYASNTMAKKAWTLFTTLQREKGFSATFGSLDPIQVIQMAKYVTSIYVSGWQCSSTASSSNEPGPDLADYPYDTVPKKVDQLFKAQVFHDRKQYEDRQGLTPEQREKQPATDFLRPIIADGDTGHGGLTAVMRLMKMFIEAGAAGVHLEDQKPGTKKCGHLAGKVLTSTQEHCDRLIAARLQADIMGTETLVVARTDAEAATLLDTNIDRRDHPFILGTTNKQIPSFVTIMEDAASGKLPAHQVEKAMADWHASAKLCTFANAVKDALIKAGKESLVAAWLEKAQTLSNSEARAHATSLLGSPVFWCWDKPRVREGYYHFNNSVEACIARGIAFSDHADLLWMETGKPEIHEARKFASAVKRVKPHAMLAYNLSPSFNWDAAGMTDKEISEYCKNLGEAGFVWQFITLAGFHADALVIDTFAKDYAQRGVLAYVEKIQRLERQNKVETLTHQKWSGATFVDSVLRSVSGSTSSTLSMGKGVTETQFKH